MTSPQRGISGSTVIAAHDALVGFAGELLGPEDAGYDEARALFDARSDPRPALIARCADAADVQRALAFARAEGHEVFVRGGGRSVAGYGDTVGVMIDLSLMRQVHVDAEARIATVGGGASIGDLQAKATPLGLGAVTGFISHVGLGGSTLHGGYGMLSPKAGFGCDNVLGLDVVTAGGERLRVDALSHPDLFWAMRGAGSNFGVVTAMDVLLHDIPSTALVGTLVWGLAEAAEVLCTLRQFVHQASEELFVVLEVAQGDGGRPHLSAWVVHLGSDADVAEAEAEPLRRLGHPLYDLFERTPFADLQTIYDEAFPMGRRHFSDGQLVPELTDSVIGAILERAHAAPSGSGRWTVELTVFVGAMQCQPDVTCAFLPQREPFWDVLAMGDWSDPAEDEAYASWARSVSEAVRCVTGESAIALPNDVSEFDQARARAAYPGVVERLVGLKARYDPDNVFHRNPNIAGAVSA